MKIKFQDLKINKNNFEIVKNTISILIVFLLFVMFLLFPIYSKTSEDIGLDLKIRGFNLIIDLFSKNSFNHPDIGKVYVDSPNIVVISSLLIMILMIANLVTLSISIKKKKSLKINFYLMISIAIYTFINFLILILPLNIKTYDIYGDNCLFYQTYSPGVYNLIIVLIMLLISIFYKKIDIENINKMKKYIIFYLMLALPLVFMIIFYIYPIFLQTVISFKDYKLANGVWNSSWTTNNFKEIFVNQEILYVIGNTIYISLIKIVISIVFPLILAIIMFDIKRQKYVKGIQTIVYIPHFFSWVVIYAISYALLNNEGVINSFLSLIGRERIEFLTSAKWFIVIQILVFGWKEIGWGTIIYYAALMNVDPSLYEAAKVDGAGPVKRLFHITIPSISSVIVFTMILALGNVLRSAGGEQLLLFYNVPLQRQTLVIDTWLYFRGLIDFEYGVGSAMSFVQSIIGIILVLLCNKLSKKLTDRAIW